MGIELVKPGGSLSFEKTKVRAVEEVYVGDSAPTEDKGYKVWVNPDGKDVAEIAELATKEYVDSAINNVDLSGYATKTYVDSAVSNIEIPEVDLSNYATKTYVDSAINNVDLSGYATTEYVDSAINNVDLSGYATKTYVDSAIGNIEIPEVDLSGYALKSEIPDTSAFRTEEEIIALIEAHGGSGEALPASEEVEF